MMNETGFSGAILRKQREALGYSIQDVQQRIHVPMKCIRAFEAGSFENMPGRAYAVGFLRSYCRFHEMDPDLFVDEYLVCCQQQQPSGRFNFMKRADDGGDLVRPYPTWCREAIAWGCVCAVLLLGWLTYNTIIHPLAESWKSRVEAGAVEIEPPVHFFEEF